MKKQRSTDVAEMEFADEGSSEDALGSFYSTDWQQQQQQQQRNFESEAAGAAQAAGAQVRELKEAAADSIALCTVVCSSVQLCIGV
jgi:hypothetical protein